MAQSARPARDPSPRLVGRRAVLRGLGVISAASAASGLVGCTLSDPRVDEPRTLPTPSPSPSASATPTLAVIVAAAAKELALGDLALAVLGSPTGRALAADRRRILVSIQDGHRQHRLALLSPDPTSRPLAPPSAPQPTPGKPTSAPRRAQTSSLADLAQRERAHAVELRTLAVSSRGFTALLWGSMAVAADCFSSALVDTPVPPPAPPGKVHHPMTALSDIEAIQAMVAQLHAMVYGYQLALGHLSESSPAGVRALARLREHRRLRDRLEDILVERSADVPAAAPAYVPPVQPRTNASAARLLQGMEVALEPFCGLMLAAGSGASDRTFALDALTGTAAAARSWGAALSIWPGWQD